MTRSDLITRLAYTLNKNVSSLDATTKQRLINGVNRTQRTVLSTPGVQHLREATITLASVADQADYVLPNTAKILRMWDPTNQRVLTEMSAQQYRLVDPVPISGTPDHFIWRSRLAVAKQPSDASEIFIDSTAAGDTQTGYVEGVITGNYPRTASVTLTGTTAVSVSTSITTWIRIDKFYLASAAVGTVTLHEDASGGTELARITIGKTNTDYIGFTLWPTPSAAITYSIDILRQITDLAQDTDVPILPEDFHDLLELGALRDELLHLKDERYGAVDREYTKRYKDFRYFVAESAMGRPSGLSRRTWGKPSQLGDWYPANT